MDVRTLITQEIAGMQEYEARKVLGERRYGGWVHTTRVIGSYGAYTWELMSEYWADGRVVDSRVVQPYAGHWVESRDIAAAQAAVAISAVLQSRGGVGSVYTVEG